MWWRHMKTENMTFAPFEASSGLLTFHHLFLTNRAIFTPSVAGQDARFPPKSFLVRPGQGKKRRVVLKNSSDNYNKVSEHNINSTWTKETLWNQMSDADRHSCMVLATRRFSTKKTKQKTYTWSIQANHWNNRLMKWIFRAYPTLRHTSLTERQVWL